MLNDKFRGVLLLIIMLLIISPKAEEFQWLRAFDNAGTPKRNNQVDQGSKQAKVISNYCKPTARPAYRQAGCRLPDW